MRLFNKYYHFILGNQKYYFIIKPNLYFSLFLLKVNLNLESLKKILTNLIFLFKIIALQQQLKNLKIFNWDMF
jgi:hypothetical protein